MISAVIIEDEPKASASLELLLKMYCPSVAVVGFATSVDFGVKTIREQKPDLIFLDIKLQDGSGFDILKQFNDFPFRIIFTTAFEEFAVKAFKLSALDYLLKPIDPEELQTAVHKAEHFLSLENSTFQVKSFLENFNSGEQTKTLVLKTTDNIYLVKTGDILYCESDKNYTRFFLKDNQKILVSRTLKEFEQILEEYNFLRIHQSFLINLVFLKQYNKKENLVFLSDNTKLPVSVRKRETLFSVFEKL